MGELKRRMKTNKIPGRPWTGRGKEVGASRGRLIDFSTPPTPEEHRRNMEYANKRAIALGLGPLFAVMLENPLGDSADATRP